MLAYPRIVTVLLLFCFPIGIAAMGDIKVTLLIFSGRKNPEWTVHKDESVKFNPIFDLLGVATEQGFAYHPDGMPGRLGYSGFLVEDKSTGNEQLIVGKETMPLQRLLLESMTEGLLPDGNIQETLTAINSGFVKAKMTGAKSKRAAPPYIPSAWTATERIRRCNNCYNYATNIRTDNYAQPGYGSGEVYNGHTENELKNAAVRDGLTIEPFFPPVPDLKATEHLVALAVKEDGPGYKGDFHFYRKDTGSYWSHKPGEQRPTRRDQDNGLITNPKGTAQSPVNLGGYKFVTYMRCDENKVAGRIKGSDICPFP